MSDRDRVEKGAQSATVCCA